MLANASNFHKTVVIFLAFCGLSAHAHEFAGGTGDPNDPYQIATAEQLISIGSDPNLLDKHFVLVNDIDLDPNLPGGRTFTQAVIAPYISHAFSFQDAPFAGQFDGGGFRIRNLTVEANTGYYIGLFGDIGTDGRVSRLGLENASIRGARYCVGLLAGVNHGAITYCHATGSVRLGAGVYWEGFGGLVGFNTGSIANSYASADVGGADTSIGVGGLVGVNVTGKIVGCYASGEVTGEDCLGGLVGSTWRGTIADCYATGGVSSKDFSLHSGGLVGYNQLGSIINCYAAVRLSNGQEKWDWGGLIGWNRQPSTAEELTSKYGVVNCFWNTQLDDVCISNGGMGLTTAQMMNPQVYSLNGWAGDPNWVLDSGKDYPHLVWEGASGEPIPAPTIDWFTGSGTPDSPYVIANAEQLARIGTAGILWDKAFVLVSDVDLTGMEFWRIGVSSGSAFTGTFDGGGHVVSNLTLGGAGVPGFSVGMFGYIGRGGRVVRLGLRGASVKIEGGPWNVGILSGTNEGVIEECSAAGDISVGVYSVNISGLVGENGVGGTIANSYSIGTIVGGDNGRAFGGLAGLNCQSRISKCYAVVSVRGGVGSSHIGGLLGEGGDVTYSLWDSEVSGLPVSSGGTGLTTAQMRTAATFVNAGWDFDEIWMICEGRDYPRLQWEEIGCDQP